jgi:hypothetical protein
MISIHLEDGVDSTDLRESDISVSRRGMVLRTRWCFSSGTELVVHLEANTDSLRGDLSRHKLEGIVVDCHEDPSNAELYLTTVLFLDAPEFLDALERSHPCALLAF